MTRHEADGRRRGKGRRAPAGAQRPALTRGLEHPVCRLGRRPSSDAGYLDAMASAIFRMGFSRAVVEKKWPGVREAFSGFAVDAVSEFGPPEVRRLMSDPAMIRNLGKIEAVIGNARTMRAMRREFAPFGRTIDRLMRERGEAELIEELGQRFARLGPKTALVFLRMTGHEMPETMAQFTTHQL